MNERGERTLDGLRDLMEAPDETRDCLRSLLAKEPEKICLRLVARVFAASGGDIVDGANLLQQMEAYANEDRDVLEDKVADEAKSYSGTCYDALYDSCGSPSALRWCAFCVHYKKGGTPASGLIERKKLRLSAIMETESLILAAFRDNADSMRHFLSRLGAVPRFDTVCPLPEEDTSLRVAELAYRHLDRTTGADLLPDVSGYVEDYLSGLNGDYSQEQLREAMCRWGAWRMMDDPKPLKGLEPVLLLDEIRREGNDMEIFGPDRIGDKDLELFHSMFFREDILVVDVCFRMIDDGCGYGFFIGTGNGEKAFVSVYNEKVLSACRTLFKDSGVLKVCLEPKLIFCFMSGKPVEDIFCHRPLQKVENFLCLKDLADAENYPEFVSWGWQRLANSREGYSCRDELDACDHIPSIIRQINGSGPFGKADITEARTRFLERAMIDSSYLLPTYEGFLDWVASPKLQPEGIPPSFRMPDSFVLVTVSFLCHDDMTADEREELQRRLLYAMYDRGFSSWRYIRLVAELPDGVACICPERLDGVCKDRLTRAAEDAVKKCGDGFDRRKIRIVIGERISGKI